MGSAKYFRSLRYLLALLLLPGVALADTWAVGTVGSRHLDRGESYCELNFGLGVEHGDALRLVAGAYRNSHCRTSAYAGASYTPWERSGWRAGGVLILVTGYESGAVVAPGALLAWEGRRYGVNVIAFPGKDGRVDHGVIGAQIKWRWR